MEHNLCRENLSAYLDGELTQKERLELETHLAGCADCRAELGQLKAVSELVKAHAMEPVLPALKRAMLEKKGASFGWLKPALALSAAAAVVAVIVNVTGVRDSALLTSSGFGSRGGTDGGLYDMNITGSAPEESSLADTGLAGKKEAPAMRAEPVWHAADAAGGGQGGALSALIPAENKRVTAAASVRGAMSQPKFASAMAAAEKEAISTAELNESVHLDKSAGAGYSTGAAGNSYKARAYPAAAPAAAREYRGPVCVQVREPASLNEADAKMEGAKGFLKSAGAKVMETAPGELRFVKDDGRTVTVPRSACRYGFIFFDGVKDPLVVTDLGALPARYRAYFGK
ncbi:MAG: zf-HC2 domain-containing protein [Elusimicrobia bacterium]|nr:zf-HC2 domain-containing protein [Elusimicrobiota bacterium]